MQTINAEIASNFEIPLLYKRFAENCYSAVTILQTGFLAIQQAIPPQNPLCGFVVKLLVGTHLPDAYKGKTLAAQGFYGMRPADEF